MTRALRILAVCLALALGACTSAGSSTTASTPPHAGSGGGGVGAPRGDSAPARDSFTGTIISGTGAYSGARGRVRVNLHPRGAGRSRPTRVVVLGQCGASSKHCTELNGVLSGTLTQAAPRVPDVGRGFNLSGT